MAGYAVVRVAGDDDSTEAFGPFSSFGSADQFRQEYSEWVCPGFGYVVVELYPVRDGQRQIRDEKEYG